ncbi:MAG: type IX secretion system membrane protein PorP/SprF, partial [Bacteroidota bacterium]
AMTGLYAGGTRVALGYRTQFYSTLSEQEYLSYIGSVENRWKLGNSYFAGGAFALRDEVGASGYNRTYFKLSGAYHQMLSEGNFRKPYMYLVVGAQGGRGQYSFDPQSLWFSNQFDNDLLEVDFNRDSGEAFLDGNSNGFTDFNAGLMFYMGQQERVGDDNIYSFYIGAAMHHISQPAVGLLEASEEFLNQRITVHGGGEIQLGLFTVMPSAAVRMQGPALSAIGGSAVRIGLGEKKDIKLRVGGWLHLAKRFDNRLIPESAIVSSIFEYDGWQVGLSYDITLSTLSRSNFSRGAFEITIIKIGESKDRYRVKCPDL